MMTHACPIHGRYDITQTECPICEKLERESRIFRQQHAVASVLTALLANGYVPVAIDDGDGWWEVDPDDQNLLALTNRVFAVEACSIRWFKDVEATDRIEGTRRRLGGGTTMFTPYENPAAVLCDYTMPGDDDYCREFCTILCKWSEYNGYE